MLPLITGRTLTLHLYLNLWGYLVHQQTRKRNDPKVRLLHPFRNISIARILQYINVFLKPKTFTPESNHCLPHLAQSYPYPFETPLFIQILRCRGWFLLNQDIRQNKKIKTYPLPPPPYPPPPPCP